MAITLDKFSRLAALQPARPSLPSAPARPATLRAPNEDDELTRLLGAGIAANRFGEYATVRNWFSSPEFAEPSPVALDLLCRTRQPSLPASSRALLADPEKWLFLDTETTGLSGGTGTYAFLIGLAWWDAGGLQVEQFLMRDFDEEYSILHELAERLAERPVLLTFNGKTFDWPLLENRFTMTRSIEKPQIAAHLDLLHPARAIWKLRLGSVRLIELERQVLDAPRLGWHRRDDLLSACIPQLYFDYLRGGPAAPLVNVVQHNQMDLRGLAALFGKINEFLATEASQYAEAAIHQIDLLGLSRFLHRRGDSDRAQTACSQALDLGLPAEFRPQARRALAGLAKRGGDHARAAELWQELVSDPQDGVTACEQLAIHYERRAKDLPRALEFTQLALRKLRKSSVSSPNFAACNGNANASRQLQHKSRLTTRLKRLQAKIAKAQTSQKIQTPSFL